MSRRRVEVDIATLAVDGLAVNDRRALGAAVQRELARLLAEQGAPAGARRPAVHRAIDGGTISAGGGDNALGATIAGAVFGGLKR